MAEEFKVNEQSAAVEEMAKEWPLIEALVGGTSAMRAAGKTFLPQFPSEEGDAYDCRLSQAVLFNAFAHTSSVLAAKPLSRPIKVDGVPSGIGEYFTDLDMFGTDLHAFCGQVMLECLRPGLMGVLVDYPPASNVRTRADERRAGVRPYMAQYPAKSILGWRSKRDANGYSLTQLRLLEDVCEPNGQFGETIIQQVRVLTPGAWQIWRENPSGEKKEWVMVEEGLTSIGVIPFVFFYGLRESFGIARPPLLDLAYMNCEHWQSSSDQQHILHVARVPVLFGKGFGDGDTITIGASTAVTSKSNDADLKYVEHTGQAIGAGRQSILDLEDRMRQVGAELLVQRPAITTATQIQSDAEANRSILQQVSEEFEDSLEACLALMGLWRNEKFKPQVQLYKDFGSANLSEKSGDLLLKAAKDGHVSSETTLAQLQRADVVPQDIDLGEEKKRIAAERAARAKEQEGQQQKPGEDAGT